MRIWSSTSLIAALFLAACGPSVPQRSALPEDQYSLHAGYFATVTYCHSAGRMSAEDAATLRRDMNMNLSGYTYDAQGLSQMSAVLIERWRNSDATQQRTWNEICAQNGRNAASGRAAEAQNRAAQLHQAQMAAAQSAVRSPQVSDWQPQPFMMPQIPVFQAPVVQTPRLSGGSYIHCNRFGSNIISCR